jgi:hypothetical protein
MRPSCSGTSGKQDRVLFCCSDGKAEVRLGSVPAGRNETAERINGVHASGIDNAEITAQVNHNLEAIAANTVGERVLNSAELTAAIAAGGDLIAMLNGKKEFPQSVTDIVKRVGAPSAATAITAYLFN